MEIRRPLMWWKSATKPTEQGGFGKLGDAPTLLAFSVEESPSCRAVDENLRWLAARHRGYLQIQQIDAWEDPEAIVEFQVTSLPTLVLRIGGQEVARLAGTSSKRKMTRRFEPVLNGFILGSACREACPLQDPTWAREDERTSLPG